MVLDDSVARWRHEVEGALAYRPRGGVRGHADIDEDRRGRGEGQRVDAGVHIRERSVARIVGVARIAGVVRPAGRRVALGLPGNETVGRGVAVDDVRDVAVLVRRAGRCH